MALGLHNTNTEFKPVVYYIILLLGEYYCVTSDFIADVGCASDKDGCEAFAWEFTVFFLLCSLDTGGSE